MLPFFVDEFSIVQNVCSTTLQVVETAPMVKLVDTADLKSAAFRKRGVPVRPRLGAPSL